MAFDETIKKYNELLNQNTANKSHDTEQQIVNLLEDFLLEDNIPDELKIWAYWNISDNYALQRKHERTFNNHLKFETFARTLQSTNPNYMLMLICDTTQRLSLIESGNSEYWSNLYYEIMDNLKINDSNYCILFEVLRTALYPLAMKENIEQADHAIEKMKSLVSKYSNDSQILRFMNLYYCCLLSYNYIKGISNDDILTNSYQLFSQLKVHLKDDKIRDNILFGTYDDWNSKRSSWQQARSIYDYIITLIKTENYELAYKCYLEIGEEEFTNGYFKKNIKLLMEKINER
ncbi:MAG: hypothetical protein WCU90_09490 [Kiritimatiellia bacterium]